MPCTAPPSSCPRTTMADDAADVVHRRVGDDLDRARRRIDLDLADVAAVWPRRAADAVARVDDDPRLRLAGGQLEEVDAQVGAGDGERRA